MKIAVLLSAGQHPVSGAPVLPRVEAQAIRIAAGLGDVGGEVVGLHAGPDTRAVAEALGQGLPRIEHIPVPAGDDPVPALAARLAALAPDLILAGRRSQGGDESGLVPYALARALSMPLISDVVAAAAEPDGTLRLDQSLGRGALRRVLIRGSAVVTCHPDAPAPLAFAYGRARRGSVAALAAAPVAGRAAVDAAVEERPYRRRPKIVKGAPAGGSAAERLKAATGESGAASSGQLLIQPDPEDAARAILAYLRQIGVLAASAEPKT
ncbi:electron transfer flavoprotein subunit beta [Methylobacterium sp. DM1]|nr:electron transfer flavoprotein subunit beta [Methylobacterium sp. DM1]